MAKRKRSEKSKGKKSGGCISQIGGGIILVIFLAVIALFGRSSNSTRVASAPTVNRATIAPIVSTPNATEVQRTVTRAARQTEFAVTANVRFTELALTRANPTAAPENTTPRPTEIETQRLYATGNANLRPCTKTTSACAPAGAVSGGQELTVLGQVEGDTVSGSTVWYKVLHNGQELYIHSSLVSATRPTVQPTRAQSAGGGGQSSSPANTPIVASTIEQPPVVGASCPGFDYTCPQLTCEQAYACLAAGNGRLDADKDGKPCETQCGG